MTVCSEEMNDLDVRLDPFLGKIDDLGALVGLNGEVGLREENK